MRESVTIGLPDDAGSMTFIRDRQEVISSVDVLYERKIVHSRIGRQTHSWRLFDDAGYNMRINVYWITDNGKPFVRLADASDEYLLDLESDTLYRVVDIWGVQYAGRMDGVDTSVSASKPIDGRPWTVHVGNNEAVPLATLVRDPRSGYIGEVLGEWFTPATCVPERPIRKLFSGDWPLPKQVEQQP